MARCVIVTATVNIGTHPLALLLGWRVLEGEDKLFSSGTLVNTQNSYATSILFRSPPLLPISVIRSWPQCKQYQIIMQISIDI